MKQNVEIPNNIYKEKEKIRCGEYGDYAGDCAVK